MNLILGFDPGGEDGFGWCILQDASKPPLTIQAADVSDNAEAALEAVKLRLQGAGVIAAGIDAPMFWSPRGGRQADQTVRASIREKGAPAPGGTVQAVNSLRGACIAQGIMIAAFVRARWPDIPLTEAHPKAYVWTRGIAGVDRPAESVALASLTEFQPNPALSNVEHVRDASLAAYCAWAMLHRAAGWRDLLLEEPEPYLPICASGPLAYWYPLP